MMIDESTFRAFNHLVFDLVLFSGVRSKIDMAEFEQAMGLCCEVEDYEMAAKIRDEINKRLSEA